METATTHRLPELKQRELPDGCRDEVKSLLNEVYGYEQFRELEIYADLSKGKDKLSISQGQVIEHVIREAEKSSERLRSPGTAARRPTTFC